LKIDEDRGWTIHFIKNLSKFSHKTPIWCTISWKETGNNLYSLFRPDKIFRILTVKIGNSTSNLQKFSYHLKQMIKRHIYHNLSYSLKKFPVVSSAPQLNRSFITAINDLKTSRNYIVIPEGNSYRLRDDVTVCSVSSFLSLLSSENL
jgi:hypothetical protein